MMMIVLRPLSLLGLKPDGIGISAPDPGIGVFSQGRDVGGFVDS
jgi:hypothetical protein